MSTFTDSLGRKWSIEIDYEAVRLVRRELDLNLLALIENVDSPTSVINRLASDDILLVDTISLVCTPQIEQRKLTAHEFAQGLNPTVVLAALDALIGAIANFSRPQIGAAIRTFWAKAQDVTATMENRLSQAMTALEAMSTEQIANQALQPTKSTIKSGNSPASSESSPGGSLSASSKPCTKRRSKKAGSTRQ